MSKRSKKESQAEEEWDISESTAERILDMLIALIVMCIILCWCLVTFSVKEHILAIILSPLLIYFTLFSPGMKLRLRERLTGLLVTDILTAFNVALCILFADYAYSHEVEYMEAKIVFAIVSAFVLCLYLGRYKIMYRAIVPAVFIINLVMFSLWDINTILEIFLVFLLPLPYCVFTFTHPYYFGYGRVMVKGKYKRYPESVAKRIRATQADQRREERREKVRQRSKKV